MNAVVEAPVAEPKVETKVVKKREAARATAETMAARQRDISVSEFFAKNRHLLGFDNPRKALLTTVKEAVDNSLDACEEAGILPDITVVLEDLQPDRPASAKSSRYRVTVVDNGPGIVRKQVEHIFGRLLYGSKFHRLKMSRGQQGIGISAAGMYGLITTGKPMAIYTRPDARKPAHHIELAINTKTNRAEVTQDRETKEFPPARLRELSASTRRLAAEGTLLSAESHPTGTSVSIELDGKYQRGRGSVDEFLELTAIANPHARIAFVRPTRTTDEEEDTPLLKPRPAAPSPADAGPAAEPAPAAPAVTEDLGDLVVFPRAVNELPPETKEIQPHPKGIELGILLQMLKEAELEKPGGSLYHFLQEKFCRVSPASASGFCEKIGVTSRTKVADIDHAMAERLFKELQDSKLPPPPTDCLAPIGVQQMLKGMFKGVRAEFYAASSREAAIYRGRPFLIETAIAFGGELPADEPSRVIRFANRVPLLFQQSACSSFKAVTETNWRNYDLQHPRGALPIGPLVIMLHMASVWVPFTSESKEAIADYDEIRKEMKLALMECGRKLGTYLRKRLRMKRESERRDIFERYIGEITQAIHAINNTDAKKLYEALQAQAKKRTAIADLQLDEEGKALRDEDPADQEGVIIVETGAVSPAATPIEPAPTRAGGVRLKPDEGPALLDLEPQTRRAGARKARSGGRPSSKAGASPARPRADLSDIPGGKPTKAEAAALSVNAAQRSEEVPSKPVKPRLRLDPKTGKLAPADDGPRLF
ncbi:MAG: DNA topoisomerase VI subunit B [Phycisphaeraceae bacterium]|nr:DNA topoisomerase VI subunit B [Phycisphaeraceae bacterium]